MSPQQQASFSLFPGPPSAATPDDARPRRPSLRIITPQLIAFEPPRKQVPPPRTDTGSAQVKTLVRSSRSGRSAASVAKLPLAALDDGRPSEPQPLRSMFPTYNPDLPLDRQGYAPTQMSPSRIPRAVISRQSYYQESPSPEMPSPRSARREAPGSRWLLRPQCLGPPAVPKPCPTPQLRGLWKAANGWKASASEARVYCLELSQLNDAPPVYTLSSASSQPLYHLRLDPTSASANVTLTRHDPRKPYKMFGANVSSPASSGSRCNWHEALTTTLEEESRRRPPHDGLVALLTPSPATKMALERADDAAAVKTAENECARLVWDHDSATYFLVHPALATPFCVAIERCPAYSRTEYTLEHNQSPKHLAKLTRDGTGGGWLEIDTGVAAYIEAFYVIDVAVAALLLVASADDGSSPAPMEAFEPPPPAVLAPATGQRGAGRISRLGVHLKDMKRRRKMDQFDMDLESQDGSLSKNSGTRETRGRKLPLVMRVMISIAKGLLKSVVWMLTVAMKCMAGVFNLLYKCVGSKY